MLLAIPRWCGQQSVWLCLIAVFADVLRHAVLCATCAACRYLALGRKRSVNTDDEIKRHIYSLLQVKGVV